MTAQFSTPPAPPGLLTFDDWAALPEEGGRSELQEGVLIVSPSPRPTHQHALLELAVAIRSQLPAGLQVLPEVDVVLTETFPPTVRIPDLVVCRADPPDLLYARDALLAIEIVSPGTRGIDQVMKRHEYARAGIGHYWILDADRTLTALRLGPGEEYAEAGPPAVGRFVTDEPFAFAVDLDRL